MDRKYKSRAPVHRETRVIDSEVDRPRREKQKLASEIEDELDAMLDEIDGVLEKNAQEFVDNFIQGGGE